MIDQFAQSTASVASVSGICLGLCLATLVYVIALTPRAKRGRPFYIFLVLALIAEIIRLLFDAIRISKPGVSPYPAYLNLTSDNGSTYWSSEYINLSIATQSAAIFAYISTVGCLFVQTSSLLSNVRLNHSHVYWCVMTTLTLASAATVAFRATYTAYQVMGIQRRHNNLSAGALRQGTLVAYGASLGGWCLVSLVSVVYLLYSRLRLGVNANQFYQVTLTVLGIITLESLVVPCKLSSP